MDPPLLFSQIVFIIQTYKYAFTVTANLSAVYMSYVSLFTVIIFFHYVKKGLSMWKYIMYLHHSEINWNRHLIKNILLQKASQYCFSFFGCLPKSKVYILILRQE